MVDFRVSDGFPWHPKTLGLSHEAAGVWLYAGCWSARYLTDGYIPDEAMRQITTRRPPVDELVRHDLLQPIEGGYLMPGWLDYQRSRVQVEADRARWRDYSNRRRGKGNQ